MGDMVLVTSLIEALHRRFGCPVDVLSSGAWTRPLLAQQPGVGEIYLLGSRRAPTPLSPTHSQLIARLREREPGPVWHCDSYDEDLRLLATAGLTDEWVLDATRDCPFIEGEHHVDRYLRFAQMSPPAVAAPAPEVAAAMVAGLPSPPLEVLPEWRLDLDAWLAARGLADRRLLLMQAGNKRTMRWWARRRRRTNRKYWPEERWATIARVLLERDENAVVVLLGVPAESSLNEEIAQIAGSPRVLNAARELPIPRLLALQERATGMLSVDTGPAHSAAALGCPLVVLFGDARVDRYGPRSPTGAVEIVVPPSPSAGVLGISLLDALSAWDRLHATTAA
jgi:heptosyltransferase-2/heptosyltransferase-3